ncbi:MAG: HlyD family efflux transporter periplasmic adaptor subunit [Burkholderiaceae bacterium]
MNQLFRREAIEHRQRHWLGSIQLVRPPSLALLTGFVLCTVLAVAAWLVLGEYTRKARIAGHLVPDRGVVRLLAPQSALVLQNRVAEGATVHAGDVLFVLSVAQATADGDAQRAIGSSLSVRERSLGASAREVDLRLQERRAALARQIDAMRGELIQIDAEATLQNQRLALARDAQARLESLHRENFISAAQVQTQAQEILGLRAQVAALARQRAAQLRDIGVLESQHHELPLAARAQHSEIERELAALAQQGAENAARTQLVVRAPQDGVISGVLAEPGQTVTPATALASLLPANARLQAHLYAPSSAVGFLRHDQPVRLRYQAFPYQKFGHQAGHVAQVSRAPLQAAELAALRPGGDASEPLYRVTVDLDAQSVAAYGVAQPLVPGMQLDADVLLDRRRLIEWIFEPVLGIAGRM